MKKYLVLWLGLIVMKYALLAAVFSTSPASVVTFSYDRGSMTLTAGLVLLLAFLIGRERVSGSKAAREKIPSRVPARPVASA
jgi:uncharacterized integral membrane protein